MEEWEKVFNETFISPKTMWAHNNEGIWFGREDIKSFILVQIAKARKEGAEKMYDFLNNDNDLRVPNSFKGTIKEYALSIFNKLT